MVVQGLSWGTGRAAEQARLGAIECDGESLVGGDAGGGGGEEVDEIEEIEEV